jgi:hypothetical protein
MFRGLVIGGVVTVGFLVILFTNHPRNTSTGSIVAPQTGPNTSVSKGDFIRGCTDEHAPESQCECAYAVLVDMHGKGWLEDKTITKRILSEGLNGDETYAVAQKCQ